MESKLVKIQPIKREGTWLSEISKNHDGIILFSGTGVTYSVPETSSGKLVDVLDGVSEEQVKWLEKELGLAENELSPNRQKDNFWRTKKMARVKLTKDVLPLDLSNPIDFIKYLVLKCNTEFVAPSWESRFEKGTYKFAIVDKDTEVQEGSRKADILKDAYMQYGKIEDSESKMKSVLRIYFTETKSGNKVPEKTTKEFLKSEINKIIEISPRKFIDIVKDPDFNVKSDISEALLTGYIIKIGKAKYQFKDMIDEQFTYDELLSYLKAKENSERYLILKESIKK